MMRRFLLGLMVAVAVALAGFTMVRSWPEPTAGLPQVGAAEVQTSVTRNSDALTIRVLVGLKDREATVWKGSVSLSDGTVTSADIWRRAAGDAVDADHSFELQTRSTAAGRRRVMTENGLLLTVDAPESAQLTVSTNHGDFQFRLADLRDGRRLLRLEGQASVDLVAAATEIAGTEREEDFPAAAAGRDGAVNVVYVEHEHRGTPDLAPLSSAPENFDAFRPSGGGDRLMFTRFDGQNWSSPQPLTAPGLDLWRPAVAVDGRGDVWAVWSQNTDGNWDLFCRRFQVSNERWAESQQLTHNAGADVGVVATTSASGAVWLAWQGWRGTGFDILVATLDDRGLTEVARLGSDSANQWSPAVAADGSGHVFVAYDTYENGNYDVHLATLAEGRRGAAPPAVVPIADSPSFEVRPSLICDPQNRVWIAWEKRAANWGKDDWGAVHEGPGSALYRGGSSVQVACWSGGKLWRTAGPLEENFRPPPLRNMNSYPRLGIDRSGRVWLSLRHREQRRAPAGTFWQSYVSCYEGRSWSPPMLATYSDNLLDNRPALIAGGGDQIMLIYSGDGRNRFTQAARLNNQLFAAVARREPRDEAPELVPSAAAVDEEQVTVVHADEPADVARIRDYRLPLGEKNYRLVRGEFHRHTEISGDGGGDGSLEDMWRYALDAARMDWIGNGDHDNGGGREYTWWLTQKTTDIFHHAPHFVPMFTYERSVTFPDGHRNVMFATRGIRTLPRLRPQEGENKPNNVSAGDTPMLYRYLKQFGGICAVHTSGTDMGTDWRDNDPVAEPIVEIYQGDRHNYEHFGAPRSATPETQIGGYQPDGFIWNALAKGYRLGFQASSDHISTHISYAIAVVEEPTREAILDAFQRRHCYAATDNIVLLVTSDGHLMGDEFTTSKLPSLDIHAIGTRPVTRLSLIRDLEYVYTTAPNQNEVKIRWTDREPAKGKNSIYYVRIEQEDGQIAWASPLWITYNP